MKKIILFISLIVSSLVKAQCEPGSITLNSQQDVDNFRINYPGINCVNSNVYVGPFSGSCDIANLDSIQHLTSVTGQLVFQNTSLTQVNGFANLTSCGTISFNNNASLQSINGFANTNLGALTIVNNTSLTSITGFNVPTSLSTLMISGNPVSTLSGLTNLTSLTTFILQSSNLTSISFLSNVSTIDYLNISNNSSLANLSGLNALTTVNSLNLNSNGLTDITALSNLQSCNTLNIFYNQLTSLNGLQGLTTVSGGINLLNVNNLTSLNGLQNLTSVGSFNIQGTSLINLNQLSNLQTVNGTLSILSNWQLNSLSGLNHTMPISGDLTITGNGSLPNCAALAICNYLTAPSGVTTISGNAYGCNNTAQVNADCAGIPYTKIRTQDCGLQTTSFSQLFYADYVPVASDYEFEFVETVSGTTTYHIRNTYSESLFAAGLIAINKIYNVRVRIKVGGIWGNFGAVCQIKSPVNPVVNIRTADCGIQTTTFAQLFYADYWAGASQYEFKFVETGFGTITYHTRTTYSESFFAANVIGINKTYDVSVRAKFGSDWTNWGSSCQISSPANPLTQITANDCGTQTTAFNQLFYADYWPGASQYEFKFVETGFGTITYHTRTTYSENFQAAGLMGINKTYNVSVRAKFGNDWSNWGSSCQVSSPADPLTQITAGDCGIQTTSFTQLFYADHLAGATHYEFEFTEVGLSNPPITHIRTTSSESFSYASITGINRTFDVRVRAKFDGVWGNWGTSCELKTPASMRVANPVKNMEPEAEKDLTLFPNPTKNELNIKNAGLNSIVTVYNIAGQKVMTATLSGLNDQVELSSFDSGIYIVLIHNANNELISKERIVLEK